MMRVLGVASLVVLLHRTVLLAAPSLGVPIIHNTRGPFGVGPPWFILGVSGLVLFVLAMDVLRGRSQHRVISLTAVGSMLGGGMANLSERLLRGAVTDILFPGGLALNLADIAILGGLFLLFLHGLQRKAHGTVREKT